MAMAGQPLVVRWLSRNIKRKLYARVAVIKAAWSGGIRSEHNDRNGELGTDFVPRTDLLAKLRGGYPRGEIG
jgi:hypothetical protein